MVVAERRPWAHHTLQTRHLDDQRVAGVRVEER